MEGATGIAVVTGAVGEVIDLAGTILTAVMGQPVLLFIMAAGFIGIGARVLRKLFRVSKVA